MRILVIEDEVKVARALKEGLEGEHYDVVVAKTGEEGFFRANADSEHMVTLREKGNVSDRVRIGRMLGLLSV